MYFEDRTHAGRLLAEPLLEKYRYENCAVVALSDGGVVVAEEIAVRLHCALMLIVSEDIDIPGEGLSFGGVSQSGQFTYNSELSSGEIYQYTSEFHGYLDEKKREAFQRINRLIGDGGTVDKDLLRDRVVILVSDGFGDDASIDVALDFLKPIRIERLVVASPTATVPAVDRLHVAADELHILDVKANWLGVDHYYDRNNIPTHEETIAHINEIILNWR
jgi:predicted phosphoribosyltransferase